MCAHIVVCLPPAVRQAELLISPTLPFSQVLSISDQMHLFHAMHSEVFKMFLFPQLRNTDDIEIITLHDITIASKYIQM